MNKKYENIIPYFKSDLKKLYRGIMIIGKMGQGKSF